MRTLYLQTKHLKDLITHCSCSLSVGVYWPSTTALKRKLSWWIAFTNALKPSSKFCSALLLPFPVKVRVSVIQVEVRLPGPDCWLHWGLLHGSLTAFWRHISLVHSSGGIVSPTDVPRPFLLCWDISLWISLSLSEQAVVSQRRIMGCLFFQRLPYANRSIPDH